MRRQPKQARARATVEAIEEAAALLLERGDEFGFTTNHIAERAGVSIGSLYEYFADKDDILRSRGKAEAERLSQELKARWSARTHEGEALLQAREIIALPLLPFRGRPALAHAMLRRYAGSRWAISLARRHLESFLDRIGEEKTLRLFGMPRGQLIALIPRVAAAVEARESSRTLRSSA